MQPKWYFDKFVRPYLRNKEILSSKELLQIDDFVRRLVPVAMKRTRFLNQLERTVYNSFYNATISEVAIENYTGTKFIHWKIREESEQDMTDLYFLGLKMGIKTAEFGNIPLVYFPNRIVTPEIMTIFEPPNVVYVVGYATVPMLKYYQSNEYVFGKVKDYKSGFWGFHKLHEFKTMDDLRNLYNNSQLNNYNDFHDTVKDYPSKDGIITFEEF